jgi:hypothetical protein
VTIENAQTTCGWCNASKGARSFRMNPPPGYEDAELAEKDRPRRFEQLWTRQVGDDRRALLPPDGRQAAGAAALLRAAGAGFLLDRAGRRIILLTVFTKSMSMKACSWATSPQV